MMIEKAGPASAMRFVDVLCVFLYDLLLLDQGVSGWSLFGALLIVNAIFLNVCRKMREKKKKKREEEGGAEAELGHATLQLRLDSPAGTTGGESSPSPGSELGLISAASALNRQVASDKLDYDYMDDGDNGNDGNGGRGGGGGQVEMALLAAMDAEDEVDSDLIDDDDFSDDF
jgi:hypothetical protein